MFDAKTMELAQELRVEGSVQAIVVTDHNNFLLLGVNNKIQAYDMPAFLPQAHGPGGSLTKPGKLDLLCSKESGTFIHSIVKLATPGTTSMPDGLPESLIVGDMTGRGISTFELKQSH